MTRAFLVLLGSAAVALAIMLFGQYAASIMFPVTSDAPAAPVETMATPSEIPPLPLVRLHVPFEALVAHVAASVVAALTGGFLAARLAPGALWPVWGVAGVLAGWELLAVADNPKSVSFSVSVAATCLACTWLGAVLSQIRTEPRPLVCWI
jgi:hypothetical protein